MRTSRLSSTLCIMRRPARWAWPPSVPVMATCSRSIATSMVTRTPSSYEIPLSNSKFPSSEDVDSLPRKFRELSNESLSVMATQGVHGAHKERLIREIMRVDKVAWGEARVVVEVMDKANDEGIGMFTMPYKFGLAFGAIFGIGSIPFVFHAPSAIWFNNQFVHDDLPEGGMEALDTVYKVGSWTWGWMEPVLGTASFVLLCLQFMRAQMVNVNLKPYSAMIRSYRGDRLARRFPQYESSIVRDFGKSDEWGHGGGSGGGKK